MTTKSKTPATGSAAAEGRRPTHRLYRVLGDGDGAIWTPLGAAWPNKDGEGVSLNCDANPLTCRTVLRLIEPRPEAAI